MGVNALLGIFLTFLGGYWAALHCGVDSFLTVRKLTRTATTCWDDATLIRTLNVAAPTAQLLKPRKTAGTKANCDQRYCHGD